MWYIHLGHSLMKLGLRDSELERGFSTLRDPGSQRLVAVLHTHVDDCLVVTDEQSEHAASVLNTAKAQLHML